MSLFKVTVWNGAWRGAAPLFSDPLPPWHARFFSSVYRFSDDPNACWVWTGPFDGCGYGMFSFNRQSASGGRTAAVRAHRFLIEQSLGHEIAPGLVVLHSCDTPCCVNPRHLSIGTIDANMADRNAKGRQARGESSAKAKLTEQQVLEIRASDRRPNELAVEYGVQRPAIYSIKSRRIWRHI